MPPVSPPLPKELRLTHIVKAVDYVEGRAAEFVDLYYEQANVFSAVVYELSGVSVSGGKPVLAK